MSAKFWCDKSSSSIVGTPGTRALRSRRGSTSRGGSRPVRRCGGYLDDLRLHEVRQVTRTVAVGPALNLPFVLAGEEDAQRADDAVAVAHPGVGVERQRHVDRNAQPRGVGRRPSRPLGH